MTLRVNSNNIQSETLAAISGPRMSNVEITDSSYSVIDDTAVDIAGGYIKISGTNFVSGCQVLIDVTAATTVTYISSTEVRAQVPAKTAGSYTVYLVNPNGDTAIRVNGLTYSAFPAWSTGSTLPTNFVEVLVSIQLSASSNSNVSYALAAGSSLPPGLTLSNAGVITGTVSGVSVETIYNFTVVATDLEFQDTSRTFSVTISVGDDKWSYVTALLSPAIPVLPFNDDASTNNFVITVNGDTKPNNFNPYTPGRYSVFFDTKTDYISVPATTALTNFTGDFTFEAWIYPTDTTITYWVFWDSRQSGATAQGMLFGVVPLASAVTGQGRPNYFNGTNYYSTGIVYYNRWTHVAYVRSGTTLTFYIDGIASGTATVTGTQIGTATTNPVYISTKDNGLTSYGTTGYLSNFRIVNGTAVYTSNFTPSTEPLTAVTNTVLLTCQSNRFVDNSTNNYTLTPSSVSISGFDPYLPDSSTSGYGSTYFDGTGDTLTIASTAPLQFGSGDFTMETWYYCSGTISTAGQWLFFRRTTVAAIGLVLQVDGSKLRLLAGDSSTAAWEVDISSATTLVAGTWYHLAMSRSGSTWRIFVNGLIENTATSSFTIAEETGNITIGTSITGYLSNHRIIKGTALYTANFTPPAAPLTAVANTSLLTFQTNQPANNNVFLDSSTNALVLSKFGNATQGTFSPYGENWSNYFDGTGDYLTFTNTTGQGLNFGTGDFTVELWYYMTNNTTNTLYHAFIRQDTATNSFDFGYRPSASQLVLGSSGVGDTTVTITLAINTWYHIAVSRSGTNLRFYVNGTQVGTTATNSYNFGVTGGTVRIGSSNYDGTHTVYGYLSNLRCTKSAVYTSNFTPSVTPLQPIAGTSLLTCKDPNFVDDRPNNYTITRNGDVSVQKFGPFAGTTLPTPYYSAYFDGSGDEITWSGTTIGTSQYTFECWFHTNSLSGPIGVLGTSVSQGLNIRINSATQINVDSYNQSATAFVVPTMSTGTWYHLAVCRSSSNQTTVFLNGTRSSTGAVTISTNYSASSRIGASAELNNFNGYISNARLVVSSTVYDPTQSTITVPTSPLTAVANTMVLTCQSSTFIDNSTNNFTITASGNSKPTTYTPFTVTYSTKQSYTPAVYGGSMSFDGTGDYLTSSSNAAVGTGPFTIEAWVYLNSVGTLKSIIDNSYWNIGNNGGYRFMITTGNVLKLMASSGTYNIYPDVITGTTALTTGQWYHVAAVRNSANAINLYVNGVVAATPVTYSSSLNLGGGQTLKIGGHIADGGSYDVFNGYISDARVIPGQALYNSNFVPGNRPLTPIKNTTLLATGTGAAIYNSSEINNLETVGDAKSSHFGPYNGSYYSAYFDGTGDYLSAPASTNFQFPGDFTIEGWMYFTNIAGGSPQALFSVVSGTAEFDVRWFTTRWQVSLNAGSGTNIGTAPAPVNGTWTHVACVRSGSTISLYVNGVATGTTITNSSTLGHATSVATVGAKNGGSNIFTGYISNIRVVKGTALYTANFTPPTSPLTAVAGTSLLTCQSNKFVDNSTNNFTITRAGDTKVATQNPFQINSGQSIIFDGTGDYLTTYDPSYSLSVGTGDFTFECWAYVNSMPSVVTAFYHLKNDAALATTVFAIELSPAGALGLSTGTSVIASGTTGRITVNNWIHIAVVRTSGVLKTFINGTQDISISNTTTYNGTYLQISAWRYNTYDYSLNGYISDLRITKGYARYTANFTVPATAHLNR